MSSQSSDSGITAPDPQARDYLPLPRLAQQPPKPTLGAPPIQNVAKDLEEGRENG